MLPSIHLFELADRCAELRRQVTAADAWSISHASVLRSQGAMTRASVYVWAAAGLEQFVRNELNALFHEIGSAALKTHEIQPSLQALLLLPDFERLRSVNGLKMWLTRAELLEKACASQLATFSPDAHPLDRRTLKGEHFDTIWAVCKFTGDSLPSPRHRLALKELSTLRNELAHGRVDPLSFGRGKTTRDTLRAIEAVEDVAQHLHVTADAYVQASAFKR